MANRSHSCRQVRHAGTGDSSVRKWRMAKAALPVPATAHAIIAPKSGQALGRLVEVEADELIDQAEADRR